VPISEALSIWWQVLAKNAVRMREVRPVLSICGECRQESAKPGTAFWVCRGLKKKKEEEVFNLRAVLQMYSTCSIQHLPAR